MVAAGTSNSYGRSAVCCLPPRATSLVASAATVDSTDLRSASPHLKDPTDLSATNLSAPFDEPPRISSPLSPCVAEPGAWSNKKWTEWQATLQKWKKRQKEWQYNQRCINSPNVDVFSRNDVADLGSVEPLFSEVAFEARALLSIRVELHLLMYVPSTPTLPQDHLPLYYSKLFNKQLTISHYGFTVFREHAQTINDTLVLKGESLAPQLGKNTEFGHFVKLTADHRRNRIRRMDAGEEMVALKFSSKLGR